jgi:hypothetical protein
MTDNPLGLLIQLCLLTLLILAILLITYMVINHKLISNLYKENKELRAKLARYEQPQEPEWVQYLFNDQPSDPAISALN